MKTRILTALTATAALALTVVPSASAIYGDRYGLETINGHPEALQSAPAIPGDHAFWAGACDRSADPGIGVDMGPLGGFGTRPPQILAPVHISNPPGQALLPAPPSPDHCIDYGGQAFLDTQETIWQSYPRPTGQNLPGAGCTVVDPCDFAPQWRLPAAKQAGSHPDGSTLFVWAKNRDPDDGAANTDPDGSVDNIYADLPPGFVANPQAVDKCTGEQFAAQPVSCPPSSQVGVLRLYTKAECFGTPCNLGNSYDTTYPVYNLEPRKGNAAELGFAYAAGFPTVRLVGKVRTNEDFGVSAFTGQIPAALIPVGQTITLWGVPWRAENDLWRTPFPDRTNIPAQCLDAEGAPSAGISNYLPPNGLQPAELCQAPYEESWGPMQPFISSHTECDGAVKTVRLATDSFQNPGAFTSEGDPDIPTYPALASESSNWRTYASDSPPIAGCEQLEFPAELDARPTTDVADSPTGLDVDLSIPQSSDPNGLATAHLKKTTVELPEGLTLNPAAANGLAACSSEQIGLKTASGAHPAPIRFNNDDPADGKGRDCPEAARIARAEVETPLLDPADYPTGEVYVATPFDNPFDSLLAIYIVLRSPDRGFIAKVAGEVHTDPETGQLTTTFDNNPQLPFSEFKLDFKGGANAPLKTPSTCGSYSTTSTLTPWSAPQSGPPVVSVDSYEIGKGPGSSCVGSEAELSHAPEFDAGTVSPLAGRYSPFVLNLRRADGSQRFGSLTVTPPPGLTAKLAGTPACSDAALSAAAAKDGADEQASPSCPPASEVGDVFAAAGVGPDPYNAPGKAYLAGPYKGAPLSLAIVTPAVAGPFDLGTVVVRTALHVNPRTAQITAVADPIPHILDGINLEVRSVSVRLDKPEFSLNPTSCDPMAVDGLMLSTLGTPAALHSRFQLAECGRLAFKPRLSLRLFGGVKRAKYQGLRAIVRPRPGDANIARTVVRMPRSAFLAQEHIRTVCTRVQFAADTCPKGAIYGRAIAYSPLLDQPLWGNVYLRSSDNPLPDLVADLRGPAHQPIRIELVGRTDSVKGALRNTFDIAPDAPVSFFSLQLFGGKKGLIVNSRNICRGKNKAGVRLDAHNGRREILQPVVRNKRCNKIRRKAKKRKRAGHRKQAAKRQGAGRRAAR
jgi:hypothetical protein